MKRKEKKKEHVTSQVKKQKNKKNKQIKTKTQIFLPVVRGYVWSLISQMDVT